MKKGQYRCYKDEDYLQAQNVSVRIGEEGNEIVKTRKGEKFNESGQPQERQGTPSERTEFSP